MVPALGLDLGSFIMRVAVVGATGRTGRHVVEQALARGHRVTALARRPEVLSLRDERLLTAAADVLDRARLAELLAGSEAVVSTLGVGTSRAPTVLYSQGIANVLHGMHVHGISRVSVVSAAPVGPRAEQPFLERRVAMPLLERVFGATYEDMRRMEALLRSSEVEWVALRPPRLVDKAATGRYRVDANRPLPKARSLTYADLATALLDSLDREDLGRRAVFIAN
jgi:putative NADH-flavin reductase